MSPRSIRTVDANQIYITFACGRTPGNNVYRHNARLSPITFGRKPFGTAENGLMVFVSLTDLQLRMYQRSFIISDTFLKKRAAFREVEKLLRVQLAPLHLRLIDFCCLTVLARVGRLVPESELCRALGIDRPATAKCVARLGQLRLIRTSGDVDDRRRRQLELTKAGHRHLRFIEHKLSQDVSHFFG